MIPIIVDISGQSIRQKSNCITKIKNIKNIKNYILVNNCLVKRYNNIKQLHRDRFKLAFTSGLSICDTYSDIYTIITYYSNGYHNWFYVGTTLIVLPQIVMGLRYYSAHVQTVGIEKKSLWINLSAILLCVTPLATAYDGWKTGSDPNGNLSKIKFLETILESYPQLVLQTYIFFYIQTGPLEQQYNSDKLIPMGISIAISILSVFWGIDVYIYKSNLIIRVVNITHLICWLCRWIILATSFNLWAFIYIPTANIVSLIYFSSDDTRNSRILGFNYIILSHIGFSGHDVTTATYFALETVTFTPIILILSLTNILTENNNRLGFCNENTVDICYPATFIWFTISISIFYIGLICAIKIKNIKLYVEKPYSLFQ